MRNLLISGPHTFQKNVTASTFMIDGKIKELEIAFTVRKIQSIPMFVMCSIAAAPKAV